uniref:SUN domain-containing protein 2-like n=1 Tax=Phascolarctos cinereus TaxID=38626 RepID=A0A6P5JPC1_PHACI|nr:SUN domain-containing protein 2-like [Phascolarctos cinereus]
MKEEKVHEIMQQAPKLYREDHIGLVDHTLESSGVSILSSHSSKTCGTRMAIISLFGITLWYRFQTQRAILQPNVCPDNCWAFQGPRALLAFPYLPASTSLPSLWSMCPKPCPQSATSPEPPRTLSSWGSMKIPRWREWPSGSSPMIMLGRPFRPSTFS